MRSVLSRVALAVAASALVLTGCASGPAPAPGGPAAAAATPASAPGPADVAFVRDMIPHHRQAVEMTDLVPGRVADPAVADLAGRITAAQGPEIDRMTGMLAGWGEPVPAPGAGMEGMTMAGMMSGAQMAGLAGLSGPAFDRAFLEMMTAHHRGAVDMARAELAAGTDPRTRALAEEIRRAQEAEIAEMTRLLGS